MNTLTGITRKTVTREGGQIVQIIEEHYLPDDVASQDTDTLTDATAFRVLVALAEASRQAKMLRGGLTLDISVPLDAQAAPALAERVKTRLNTSRLLEVVCRGIRWFGPLHLNWTCRPALPSTVALAPMSRVLPADAPARRVGFQAS